MTSFHDKMLIFSVIVSIFGICTVFLLAVNPPSSSEYPQRKLLVGSIFSLICMLGIIAALYPTKCSRRGHFKKEKNKIKGHHPTCGKFSAHVINFDNHTICSACIGLVLGALIALIGAFLYFYLEVYFFSMGFLTVLVGVVNLVFGFFQLKFKGILRLVLNTLFVVGAFFVLMGIDKLVESLIVDLFVVMLISFWLYTRILLSKWDHSRICGNCTYKCETAE